MIVERFTDMAKNKVAIDLNHGINFGGHCLLCEEPAQSSVDIRVSSEVIVVPPLIITGVTYLPVDLCNKHSAEYLYRHKLSVYVTFGSFISLFVFPAILLGLDRIGIVNVDYLFESVWKYLFYFLYFLLIVICICSIPYRRRILPVKTNCEKTWFTEKGVRQDVCLLEMTFQDKQLAEVFYNANNNPKSNDDLKN